VPKRLPSRRRADRTSSQPAEVFEGEDDDEYEDDSELIPTARPASTRDTNAEFFRLDQSDEYALF